MVRRQWQQGVTYLWMLFLVFLLGLGMGKSLEVYSTLVQREKEAELLYVGGLYREAVRQYYLSSPGGVKRYPASLEDLLQDRRYPVMRRYLRRLYPDPVTGAAFMPVLAAEGGIRGVRSGGTGRPLRQAGFGAAEAGFERAVSYGDWVFAAEE